MNHGKAFASAALVLVVGAMSAACSAAPDGVVLDREDEPQVSATTTAAHSALDGRMKKSADA